MSTTGTPAGDERSGIYVSVGAAEGDKGVVAAAAARGQGGNGGRTKGEDGSMGTGGSSEEEAEVVDELPLPELFVPGRIVHIYR